MVTAKFFGVVPSDYDVKPPFILPMGLKINTETYTKCFEEAVMA